MKDKIAGAIYGMAIGDAMGMPSELWSQARVASYFDYITDFLDGPEENEVAYQYKRGQYTDDTAQALIILDSLFTNEFQVNASDIANRLLEWAIENNAFEKNILGPSSKAALHCFKDKEDATKITNQALTNGSAMRIPPIGCLFHPSRQDELIEYVYQITKVTHSSDVTIAGACMIAMAVSSAMVNSDFSNILEDIYKVEPYALLRGAETISPSLVARTKQAIRLANEHKENEVAFLENLYQLIGCGVGISESVPSAIALAYYAQDVKKCSILCANLGGDTDTIGAMACAICGAYQGYNAMDKYQIETINASNPINLMTYVEEITKQRGI